METQHRRAARVIPVRGDGLDIVNDSTFFALRLEEADVSFAGLEPEEAGTIVEARWWRPEDLTGEPMSNGSLPDVLMRAVSAARGA